MKKYYRMEVFVTQRYMKVLEADSFLDAEAKGYAMHIHLDEANYQDAEVGEPIIESISKKDYLEEHK